MRWTGPALEDIGTPLAWLFTTLFVLAAIQVADEGPGGEPETIVVTETDTITRTQTARTTVTTTMTTTPSTGTETSTTSTTTMTGSSTQSTTATTSSTGMGGGDDGHGDVIWPFTSAQMQADWPQNYQFVGLWSGGASSAPQGSIDWHEPQRRIGIWAVGGFAAPISLGALDLTTSPESGAPFGGNVCAAKIQLYVWDASDGGRLVATIPGPSGYGHVDAFNGGQAPSIVESYVTYYFGDDQSSPPAGTSAVPGSLAAFRPTLAGLLDGHYENEGTGLMLPDGGLQSFFFGWGDTYISGKVDDLVTTNRASQCPV